MTGRRLAMPSREVRVSDYAEQHAEDGEARRFNEYCSSDWFRITVDNRGPGGIGFAVITIYVEHDGAYIADDNGRLLLSGNRRHRNSSKYRAGLSGVPGGLVLASFMREMHHLELREMKAA